ncbi:MAG TPA: hypothetical protein VGC90_01975 [Candidatus Limnocylindrales bacterium]
MGTRHASNPSSPTESTPGADGVRAAYRGLRSMGWSDAEASSLAAHLAGLAVTRVGWRIREVEGLLFIRSLVSSGRLDP